MSEPIGRVTPVRSSLLCLAFLVLVAFVSRGRAIGDLQPHVDEEFYLLVADRMWHGALPYVDIWDRKPIGLFLLYAGFRPFSGYGIVAYQVAALVFAVATAFVILRLGTRLGSLIAAVSAGALYLLYLPVIGGGGGQSPVFYNFFVALAGLVTVKAAEADQRQSVLRYGLVAMLLVGVAIQVKYTAFVEGVGFGLYMLWLGWTRSRHLGRLFVLAVALVATALLPTMLAFTYFAARGFGGAFVQANFVSIFLAKEPPGGAGVSSLEFLSQTALKMAPMLLIAAFAIVLGTRARSAPRWTPLLLCWCAFSLIEFAIIGRFYGHYALPTLVPLSLVAMPLLESSVAVGIVLPFVFFWARAYQPPVAQIDAQHHVEQLVESLKPYAAQGCIYLRDGPPIVYLLTGSCLPTPFVFPEHLTTVLESRATNATVSMGRLLEGRPSAIVLSDRKLQHAPNLETQRMLGDALKSRYRLLTRIPEPNGIDHESIYVRADLKPAEHQLPQ